MKKPMVKRNIVFLLVAACATMAFGATTCELAEAKEVNARRGVGNFLAKFNAGGPVTVAYLGGSITAMNGWRNLTTDWLRKTNPKASVTEVHAAIGGTGSGLGVFRVGHDALDENPDLLFIEFATRAFVGSVPKEDGKGSRKS